MEGFMKNWLKGTEVKEEKQKNVTTHEGESFTTPDVADGSKSCWVFKESGSLPVAVPTNISPEKRRSNKGRSFQESWKKQFLWLELSTDEDKLGKVVCTVCTQTVAKSLLLPKGFHASQAKEAFVDKGFCAWQRALDAFKNDEKSEFHQHSASGVANLTKTSVLECISVEKRKKMKAARTALEKIFHTVNFIAQEGLPFRASDNNEKSKFMGILRMRATDLPELDTWMKQSGYKWLHHDTIEEILKLQTDAVVQKLLTEVKAAKFFSLILDETSDIIRLEQVSLSLRFVQDDFHIREEFLGFYQTDNTTSENLYDITKDFFLRYNLDIKNLRGQCFDVAANLRGKLSGLQARLKKDEPRALYVHCVAHRLNLAVQDALQDITHVRDYIGIVKDLINFVRDLPKRLALFKELHDENSPLLSKFCPTRWCVRIKSLKCVLINYASLMLFFEIGNSKQSDASSTAAALGFLNKMETFAFYFNLKSLIAIFERVESLNGELQKKELSVNESHTKVEIMKKAFKTMRERGFDELWLQVETAAAKLELEHPVVPRLRKASRRFDSESSPHVFSTPRQYYQKLFYEVIDVTLNSLYDRFQSDTIEFLNAVENFIIKDTESKVDVDVVTSFYNTDSNNCEFDGNRLKLHRDMLIDIMLSKNGKGPMCIMDVIKFLKANIELAGLVQEMAKLCRIVLTIPTSSCTAERSFSALRRLKTYLRSSLGQERLNHISILHVHRDYAEVLDLKPLMHEWI